MLLKLLVVYLVLKLGHIPLTHTLKKVKTQNHLEAHKAIMEVDAVKIGIDEAAGTIEEDSIAEITGILTSVQQDVAILKKHPAVEKKMGIQTDLAVILETDLKLGGIVLEEKESEKIKTTGANANHHM